MYRWMLPLLLCAGAGAELARRARQAADAERPGAGRSLARPRLLGYLDDDGYSDGADNRVDKSGAGAARQFRTTCRCEKIWNCPKLQITVPRCPNEYFLCCG